MGCASVPFGAAADCNPGRPGEGLLAPTEDPQPGLTSHVSPDAWPRWKLIRVDHARGDLRQAQCRGRRATSLMKLKRLKYVDLRAVGAARPPARPNAEV